MLPDNPETVVKVILKAWTHPLDAEPGRASIELQLAIGEQNTHMCAEQTPDQARAVASALIKTADIAERSDPAEYGVLIWAQPVDSGQRLIMPPQGRQALRRVVQRSDEGRARKITTRHYPETGVAQTSARPATAC
jgi:hypothetical protein